MTRRERYIAKEAVMRYEGRPDRWVERHGRALGRMDGPPGANGKPAPLYDACRMSPEAQRRWLEEAERAKNSKVVEMPPAAVGQMALGLSEADPAALELSERQLAEAEQRLAVIRPALKLEGSARKEALQQASKAAGVSARTAYRWLERYEGNFYAGRRGLEALVDRSRKDKGKSRKLTPAAKDLIVRLLTPGGSLGNLTVKQAWQEYEAERDWRRKNADRELGGKELLLRRPYVAGDRLRADAQLPKLSYSTFRNFAQEIPEPIKVLTRKGPDAFEKTQLPTSHRDYESLDPLELVVMDHRELDLVCVLPPSKRGREARVGRPWITA
ncbi:MAG: helix-turn-helix domain-containing protein, partial [Bryobacterales bacterium]|nr:helix-turn-helix domain-containing protein [Bryobacterales bacterium]